MKITWTAGSVLALAGIVGVAILLFVAYLKRDKLAQAANLVNPASPENAVNRAITSGVTAATGRSETLGGWLADIFNPSARAVNEMYKKNPLPQNRPGYDSGGGPAYG